MEDDFEVDDSPIRELENGSIEINADAIPDDIDDPVDRGPSRDEKKRNRFREAWEKTAEAQARAKAADERTTRLEQELARLRAEAEQFAEQHQRTTEPIDDPFEKELNSLTEQEERLSREWAAVQGKISDEEAKQYLRRHQEIRDNRQRVLVRQEHQRLGGQQSQQPQVDPKVAATRAIMEDEFPEVFKNQRAMYWADAYHRQQLAKGRQADMNLLRESMDAATREFKLGGRSSRGRPPTEEERSKYRGMPAGGSGGGGGSQDGNRLVMTNDLKMLAEAAYPELAAKDPKLAYQKWAKEVWFTKDS